MNIIYIYNTNFVVDFDCLSIELNKIKSLELFENINCIITDNELETNNYVINNFDILETEIIANKKCKFILNKKMIKIKLKNSSATNNISLLIEEKLFGKIGYFACLLDYEKNNEYDIIIPDHLYNNSISEIITYLNEPKTNYLAIPDNILTRNYIFENSRTIIKTIINKCIDDLFKIREPLFVRYMLSYFFYSDRKYRKIIKFYDSCIFNKCVFYTRASRYGHMCKYNYKNFTIINSAVDTDYNDVAVMYNNKTIFQMETNYFLQDKNIIHYIENDKSYYCKLKDNGELEKINKEIYQNDILYEFRGEHLDMYIYENIYADIMLTFGTNHTEFIICENEQTIDKLTFGEKIEEKYLKFAKKILKIE